MAPFPDPPASLADAVAALRLAADRDIPEVLIAHQDDPGLHRALGLPRPPSGAELGRRVEGSAARRADGTELWLTITADADRANPGECRGQLEVIRAEPEHDRAELRIWVAPRERGRGLGAAALALAGRWLLRDAGLERLALLAPPEDVALRAAAARAGFRDEGVLRGYALGPRGRVDAVVLSLVAGDL